LEREFEEVPTFDASRLTVQYRVEQNQANDAENKTSDSHADERPKYPYARLVVKKHEDADVKTMVVRIGVAPKTRAGLRCPDSLYSGI